MKNNVCFRKILSATIALFLFFGVLSPLPFAGAEASENSEEWKEVQDIISRYYGEWDDNSYAGQYANTIPNTALMGNGDLGVASGGNAKEKTFHISKSDFWTTNGTIGAKPLPIGGVTLRSMKPESGANSTNIAPLYKSVTTSSINQSDKSKTGDKALSNSYIYNNDGTAGWGSDLGKPQWLAVEFENPVTLTKWAVHGDSAVRPAQTALNPRDFELQISDTGEDGSWTSVSAVTNNTQAICTKEIETPVTSRFFRLYLTEPIQNTNASDPRARISRLELHGETVKPPVLENFANTLRESVIATASSVNGEKIATNALGGADNTYIVNSDGTAGWGSGIGKPQWLKLEFPEEITVTKWAVHGDAAYRPAQTTLNPRDFELQISDTGADGSWTPVSAVTGNTQSIYEEDTDIPVTSKFFRLYLSEPVQNLSEPNPRGRISRLELWGPSESKENEEQEQEEEEIIPEVFYEKQDILNAKVDTELVLGNTLLSMETRTIATKNYIISKLTSNDPKNLDLQIETWAKTGNANYPVRASNTSDTISVSRKTEQPNTSYKNGWRSEGVLSTRIIGADSAITSSDSTAGKANINFTLNAGESVYIVTSVGGGGQNYSADGNLQGSAPDAQAAALSADVTDEDEVNALIDEHTSWWKDYWMQSYVGLDTNDSDIDTLQKCYYGAQYMLGCTSKEGYSASGLYGVWHTTDNPSWNSDYHLNYNFGAAYYGTFSSNRPSQALPAIEAILSYVNEGTRRAGSVDELKRLGKQNETNYNTYVEDRIAAGTLPAGIEDAVLYPVGIGPWGSTPDNSYHNQTTDAFFISFAFGYYYEYTQDKNFFSDEVYDYLQKCANFISAWAEKDSTGQYNITAGYNEGSWSYNPAVELGAYKYLLQTAIKASEVLNRDESKRAAWQDIYDNLAPPPTAVKNGKEVYAFAEKVWDSVNKRFVPMSDPLPSTNVMSMQNVFPHAQIGYFSPPEELEIMRNTIEVSSGSWNQNNSYAKLYQILTRIRYNPAAIVKNLASVYSSKAAANLWANDGEHGVEKCAAVEAVNSMLLISDKNILKVFPSWVPNKDAKFSRLRAEGAFIVSSEYDGESNNVISLEVTSEAGGMLNIVCPWEGGMRITKQGGGEVTEFDVSTVPNWDMETMYSCDTEEGATYILTEIPSDKNPNKPASFLRATINNLYSNYIINQLNTPEELGHNGVFAESFETGSFGKMIGLREDDIIAELNGESVTDTEHIFELYDSVENGADIELKIWRGNKYITISFAKSEGDGFFSVPGKIEAETFDESNRRVDGANIRPTIGTNSDPGGNGQHIGNINNIDWVMYENVNFTQAVQSMLFRVSKDGGVNSRTTIILWIDGKSANENGTLIASCLVTGHPDITDSGQAWGTYRDAAAVISKADVTGVHDLYLTFSGSVNVDWFQIEGDSLPVIKKGDINDDDEINIFDIMAIRDHIFGKSELKDNFALAADVNEDDEINIFDIMTIRDHIFGKQLIVW